jgi:hypothetical protein
LRIEAMLGSVVFYADQAWHDMCLLLMF